jgi:serine/threonine protein kinase
MALKQWVGKVVAQTDQYALGVVFFELVTGRRPYMADTPAAVLLKQANDSLLRPKGFSPDLPDEVEQVIFKVRAKDPAERFEDMGAFVEALESWKELKKAESAEEVDHLQPEQIHLKGMKRGSQPIPTQLENITKKTKRERTIPNRVLLDDPSSGGMFSPPWTVEYYVIAVDASPQMNESNSGSTSQTMMGCGG